MRSALRRRRRCSRRCCAPPAPAERATRRRADPGDAVRERVARGAHRVAGRGGVRAPRRRPECARRAGDYARRAARGVRSAAGAAGGRADRRDGDPHRSTRRRVRRSSSASLQHGGRRRGRPRARASCSSPAQVQADVTERGPLPELFATFERVARRIAPASPRTPADVERIHPPIAGVRELHQGPARGNAGHGGQLPRGGAEGRRRRSIARGSRCGRSTTEQGDHARALAAVNAVRRRFAARSRRARFLAGLSLMNLKRYDEAFTTFKALADARPTPALLNNLGVVQLRRGGTPRRRTAAVLLQQGGGRRTRPNPTTSSISATPTGSITTRRRRSTGCAKRLRRDPTDGDAHYVLGTALAAAGNAAEATREKELARRLSSTYADWDKRPARRSGAARDSSASRATSNCRTPGRSRQTLAQQPARPAGTRALLSRSRPPPVSRRRATARRSPS